MPTNLRSGKTINPEMDELSALFAKATKITKRPRATKPKPSEDDLFADMFSKITIGTKNKIGKSRRKRGTRFTVRKQKTAKKTGMDLTTGGKRRRRHSKRSHS
jgi:hypothetical protein